jgi:hypothetical protein
MKILGRQISNWWLLLLVVILVILSPLLLIGFFAANNLAGAIFGPPAIWNRPWESPRSRDIAGSYHETERYWQDHEHGPTARLQLSADGTMKVSMLPDSDGMNDCMFSGSGTWKLSPDDAAQIDLTIRSANNGNTCKLGDGGYGIYGGFHIVGHSSPHKLYWTLGDPDSGEGTWFQRD